VRARNALAWTLVSLFVIGLVVGISYGMAGFADYPALELVSGLAPLGALSGWAAEQAGGGGGGGSSSSSPRGLTSCILPGSAIPGVLSNPASKLKDGLVRKTMGSAGVDDALSPPRPRKTEKK
jgi:hypothetical protein